MNVPVATPSSCVASAWLAFRNTLTAFPSLSSRVHVASLCFMCDRIVGSVTPSRRSHRATRCFRVSHPANDEDQVSMPTPLGAYPSYSRCNTHKDSAASCAAYRICASVSGDLDQLLTCTDLGLETSWNPACLARLPCRSKRM